MLREEEKEFLIDVVKGRQIYFSNWCCERYDNYCFLLMLWEEETDIIPIDVVRFRRRTFYNWYCGRKKQTLFLFML